MKRRIALVTVLVIIALMLCGCVEKSSEQNTVDVGLRVLKQYANSYVMCDRTTGVMYWVEIHGACTPLLNADGTPRIWEGE